MDKILSWRYPPPYDFYNPPADGPREHYVFEFMRPEFNFHAVLEPSGALAGFCSFGEDGQVPGGNYRADALDIGLGMRPNLTGRGNGVAFVGAILGFAENNFDPVLLRMTVACFNKRALRLYKKFGFIVSDEFKDSNFRVDYQVLIKPPERKTGHTP